MKWAGLAGLNHISQNSFPASVQVRQAVRDNLVGECRVGSEGAAAMVLVTCGVSFSLLTSLVGGGG